MTKVSLAVESVDFGSFPQSEKQERKFTLDYSKEGIRPGDKAELTVIYEAEKAEHFSKTVTIYCNADNSPLRLKITGNAE